jgi:hypothetical protein
MNPFQAKNRRWDKLEGARQDGLRDLGGPWRVVIDLDNIVLLIRFNRLRAR